jgi:hypothetical protein
MTMTTMNAQLLAQIAEAMNDPDLAAQIAEALRPILSGQSVDLDDQSVWYGPIHGGPHDGPTADADFAAAA